MRGHVFFAFFLFFSWRLVRFRFVLFLERIIFVVLLLGQLRRRNCFFPRTGKMFIYLFICLLSFFFLKLPLLPTASPLLKLVTCLFFSLAYFSFIPSFFSCFFWPLKRRSIMAGNGGRDKKRKCSRKKIRKGVGSHRAFT